jgi:hypothetical protein
LLSLGALGTFPLLALLLRALALLAAFRGDGTVSSGRVASLLRNRLLSSVILQSAFLVQKRLRRLRGGRASDESGGEDSVVEGEQSSADFHDGSHFEEGLVRLA